MHAGDVVASYAPAPWTLMTGRFRRLQATCAAGKAPRSTRMVFYARGTTNLVRNAVECLATVPYDSGFSGSNLSCLRCSLTVSRHLHISVHKWEMVCKRRYCGTLSLRSCQPCELACTQRLGGQCTGSGSSPCPHLVAAASTSPHLAVARPCHRRPHARAPCKLPSSCSRTNP